MGSRRRSASCLDVVPTAEVGGFRRVQAYVGVFSRKLPRKSKRSTPASSSFRCLGGPLLPGAGGVGSSVNGASVHATCGSQWSASDAFRALVLLSSVRISEYGFRSRQWVVEAWPLHLCAAVAAKLRWKCLKL